MKKKSHILALLLTSLLTGCSTTDSGSVDAKAIALSHAKVDEESVIGLKVEDDRNIFSKSYEVSFYDKDYEYEYKIDRNGMIMKCDREMMRYKHSDFNNSSQGSITEEEAKSIAIEDSGIFLENIEKIRVYRNEHHGIRKFYVKFVYGNRYFEYKLSSNGDIVDVEISKMD